MSKGNKQNLCLKEKFIEVLSLASGYAKVVYAAIDNGFTLSRKSIFKNYFSLSLIRYAQFCSLFDALQNYFFL